MMADLGVRNPPARLLNCPCTIGREGDMTSKMSCRPTCPLGASRSCVAMMKTYGQRLCFYPGALQQPLTTPKYQWGT